MNKKAAPIGWGGLYFLHTTACGAIDYRASAIRRGDDPGIMQHIEQQHMCVEANSW